MEQYYNHLEYYGKCITCDKPAIVIENGEYMVNCDGHIKNPESDACDGNYKELPFNLLDARIDFLYTDPESVINIIDNTQEKLDKSLAS